MGRTLPDGSPTRGFGPCRGYSMVTLDVEGVTGLPVTREVFGAADRIRTGDVQLGNFPALSPESSRGPTNQQFVAVQPSRVIPDDVPLYRLMGSIVGSKPQAEYRASNPRVAGSTPARRTTLVIVSRSFQPLLVCGGLWRHTRSQPSRRQNGDSGGCRPCDRVFVRPTRRS